MPVKILQGAHLAEAGGFDPPLDHPVLPDGQFILQDQFQELPVRQAVGGSLLQPHLQRLEQPGEAELLEGGVQWIFHQQVLSKQVAIAPAAHAASADRRYFFTGEPLGLARESTGPDEALRGAAGAAGMGEARKRAHEVCGRFMSPLPWRCRPLVHGRGWRP